MDALNAGVNGPAESTKADRLGLPLRATVTLYVLIPLAPLCGVTCTVMRLSPGLRVMGVEAEPDDVATPLTVIVAVGSATVAVTVVVLVVFGVATV